jgi:glucose-6-phosphate 1-dehydrogenase
MTKHLNQLELARRWALSPRTLERWRWTGVGPRYLKVGKRIVYRLSDVEAFEQERLHCPPARRHELEAPSTDAKAGALAS